MDAGFKTTRERLGVTVKMVADQGGVSLRSAQFWETGKTPPPADVLAWMEALSDAVDDLVCEFLDLVDQIDDFGKDRYQALPAADAQPLVDQVHGLPTLEDAMPVIVFLRPRNEELYAELMPDCPLPYRAYCALLGILREHLRVGAWFCDTRVDWVDSDLGSVARAAAEDEAPSPVFVFSIEAGLPVLGQVYSL